MNTAFLYQSEIPLLKEKYEKAVKNSQETFEFKGVVMYVSYVKYLLEYLGELKK